MDGEADDVHVFLRKVLRLLSKSCVQCPIKYPFVTLSLLSFVVLYIFLPSFFWVVFHSCPLAVCVYLIIIVFFKKREEGRNDNKLGDTNTELTAHVHLENPNIKKSFKRVHSVRQRRAKDIWKDESTQQHNVEEEKNAIRPTDFDRKMVEKKDIKEENAKEIREAEANHSLANDSAKTSSMLPLKALKDKLNEGCRIKSFDVLRIMKSRDDVTSKARDSNEDDPKNLMDVGDESYKRLESMIARRRSQRLWSVHVRRALGIDRKDHQGQLVPIIIPKHNSGLHPTDALDDPFSLPGSAPSVLVPMRNPFDLPYDPQEEKPDLTGDNFSQEFMSGSNKADVVFCRHRSFNLGGFSPKLGQKTDDSFLDFVGGFGRRNSFNRYGFSRLGQEPDKEFSQMTEEESQEEPKSMSETDTKEDDRVKETTEKEDTDDAQARPNPIPEENKEARSRSRSSSDEEDEPIYKIDKKAILRSLSMARRQVVNKMDNKNDVMVRCDEENNHDRINSRDEGNTDDQINSRHEENNDDQINSRYHDRITRRHAPSYSIASDMQVEVSDVGSPPFVIDENFAYDEGDIATYVGNSDEEMSSSSCSDGGDSAICSSENPSSPTQGSEVNENEDEDGSRITKSGDTTLSNSESEETQENLNADYDAKGSSSSTVSREGSVQHFPNLLLQQNEQQS